MVPDTSKGKRAFHLPADVSFEKRRLRDAWAYVFRHRVLGELGRIVLQELGDGRCHLSYEVVGDPVDPMTAQRMAIFKPLGLELARRMEMALGTTPEDAGWVEPVRHGHFAMCHRFLDLPNMIGSPHNSAGGGAWRDEYLRRAVQNCRRAILGETPWNLIGSDERML